MGLAFLPWERLPAYIFGPLLILLGSMLLVVDDDRTLWGTVGLLSIVGVGPWVMWARYKTGEEPLWSEERRKAARESRRK